MPATESPETLDIDPDAVVVAAREAADGTVYSLVEFDHDSFQTLYVPDETREMYEDDAEMRAHFEQIHDYVNLDFTEIELFTKDLLPVASEVRYKTTAMDVMTFVRIYLDEERGLFMALEADEAVEPVVAAIEAAVDG